MTMALLAAMSLWHTVWIWFANHPMFDVHCSALRSVLQVPQMTTLSSEMFR